MGCRKPVNSVAFSPDGRTSLSCSGDQTVKLWDIATGKELASFTGHEAEVFTVAFSPDGRTALSGGYDGRLILWDVATGYKLRTIAADAFVNAVAFSPDGRTALSGSGNSILGEASCCGMSRRAGNFARRAIRSQSIRSRSPPMAAAPFPEVAME